MKRLKQEAARQGRTMSELVEAALRLFLRPASNRPTAPKLPTHDLGQELVDVSDREALDRVLDER